MGVSVNKTAKSDSSVVYCLTQATEDDAIWEELIQRTECCGFIRNKVIKKRVTWQEVFIGNANQIRSEFGWAKDMIEMVNNCKLPKKQYLADINQLKKMAYVQRISQEQVESPQDLQKVKDKIKQSAVVSLSNYGKSAKDELKRAGMESILTRHRGRQLSRYKNSISSSHVDRKLQRSVMSKMQSSVKDLLASSNVTQTTQSELDLFIKFSDILSIHLRDIQCILGRLQRLFIVYIEKTYRVFTVSEARIISLVEDVNQFLLLMREAVTDYYRLGIFRDPQWQNTFLANPQNILSICTNLLFKDTTFYTVIFGNIAEFCKENDQKFEEIIKKLQQFGPEEFMVKEQFCLNERTLLSWAKGIKRQTQTSQAAATEPAQAEEKKFEPYKQCTQALQQISKARSPLDKMKAIMDCSQGITQAIELFYEEQQLPREQWLLDADQVLSIFCYIITRAKVQHLHAHLFILQQFSTSHQAMSMSGYYMSVLSCAVEQVMLQDQCGMHGQ